MFDKLQALRLSKLENYSEFLRNPENLGGKRGVYIWGFRFFDPKTKITTEFIPYYVGKHRSNIHQRIQEHFSSIRYGTHKIILSNLLNDTDNYRSQDPKKYAFLNTDNKNRRKEYLPPEEQTELAKHVNAYLDNFYVTYIDISFLNLSGNEENIFVDQLERYIQKIVSDENIVCRNGVRLMPEFRPEIIPSKGTEHILHNYPLPISL